MPQEFPLQRHLLFRNRSMTEPAAPVGDHLGRPVQSAAGGLGLHGPAATSVLAPVQREAQEIGRMPSGEGALALPEGGADDVDDDWFSLVHSLTR